MGAMSGITMAGEKPAPVCPVPSLGGVLVRNTGTVVVWVGGPDVTAGDGYPLEPGGPGEQITGAARGKQSPVVPAPPDDTAPVVLHGCTEAGESPVAWILMGGA
jgi:hypothetical protein